MPFTISHTVAVIPLYKYLGRFGALSALIIGSMIPDFEYIIPNFDNFYVDAHSLTGIYFFAIPVGLAVYYLYHVLMAPVIVSILPKFIQKHLHSDLFIGRLPNIPTFTLIFSLVFGALTHIIWDFFTHHSGIPQYIDWMNRPLIAIDSYDIMPYRVLQHFSTMLGLSLLVFWLWVWISKKKHVETTHNSPPLWNAPKPLKLLSFFVILAAPIIFGTINGLANLSGESVLYGLYDAQLFLRYGIVGGATAFIISCVLLGLLYQLQIQRHLNKDNITSKNS